MTFRILNEHIIFTGKRNHIINRVRGTFTPPFMFNQINYITFSYFMTKFKEERRKTISNIFVCKARETIASILKNNDLNSNRQSYIKYRPNETTGGIFVSWRRKEELPTGLD